MKIQKIKNPCPICGNKTDSQGWCGSRNHDAGNPFGGINCFVVFPDKAENKETKSMTIEGVSNDSQMTVK